MSIDRISKTQNAAPMVKASRLMVLPASLLAGFIGIAGITPNGLAQQSFQLQVISALKSVAREQDAELRVGESQINGMKLPMHSMVVVQATADFAEKVRKKIGPTGLVAVHHTSYSDVVVVSPSDARDHEQSARTSYVLSIMNLPDGSRLAFASPAGDLLRAHLRSPSFQAAWINEARNGLQPIGSSSHRFAESLSQQELAQCTVAPIQCRSMITADLRNSGYLPVNPEEKSLIDARDVSSVSDADYHGVWRKNSSTVYINITKQGAGRPAEVGVYEVTTR